MIFNAHEAGAAMGRILYFNIHKLCHNVSNISEIMGGAHDCAPPEMLFKIETNRPAQKIYFLSLR
jgi:hypothetical protein